MQQSYGSQSVGQLKILVLRYLLIKAPGQVFIYEHRCPKANSQCQSILPDLALLLANVSDEGSGNAGYTNRSWSAVEVLQPATTPVLVDEGARLRLHIGQLSAFSYAAAQGSGAATSLP